MTIDLVGYLLGALDGAERDEIQKALETDPALRRELLTLEARLAPLERERWAFDAPPVGLAARTCALVKEHDRATRSTSTANPTSTAISTSATARQASSHAPTSPIISPARRETKLFGDTPGMSPRLERSGSGGSWFRWTRADFSLMAGMTVAAICLLAPSLLRNREQARLATCANNLRDLGVALPMWAGMTNGYAPLIPAHGNAGVAGFYAPQLMRAGLVSTDQTFVCPDSAIAVNRFHVPSLRTIYDANGVELVRLQRQMGGSYYYSLGYVEGNRLNGRRIRGDRSTPILAEGLNSHSARNGWSSGRVINVLFEDGHVGRRFVANQEFDSDRRGEASIPLDMFVSDRGEVEAGRNAADIVLAPSWARPAPYFLAETLIQDAPPSTFDLFRSQGDLHHIDTGSVLRQFTPSPPYPWWIRD